LGKRYSSVKKIIEKNLCCCRLNKEIGTFYLKTEDIRIKPNFGIFLKIYILRFW
jgi:hypothetical protein